MAASAVTGASRAGGVGQESGRQRREEGAPGKLFKKWHFRGLVADRIQGPGRKEWVFGTSIWVEGGRSGAGESIQKKHQGPPGEEPTHWLGPINECVGRFLWHFLGKKYPQTHLFRDESVLHGLERREPPTFPFLLPPLLCFPSFWLSKSLAVSRTFSTPPSLSMLPTLFVQTLLRHQVLAPLRRLW